MDIEYEMLSPHMKDILEKTSPIGSAKKYSQRKLIGSYLPRTQYTTHHMNLKLYLEKGLVVKNTSHCSYSIIIFFYFFQVTKIHSAIKFRQSRHLKEYIELCVKKRNSANSEFEKNLYKLLINGCYGNSDIVFNMI